MCELPEIFSYEWKKISEILEIIKIAPDAYKNLQYFDEGDFWYRTFSYKDGNFFEIICLAKMDTTGGKSTNGPKKGYLIYDERENKWTQNFNAVEYDELKPSVEKEDDEPKKVPGDGKDTEVIPEPEDDDEKADAEKKVFDEIFTKFFQASNSLEPAKFLASIYLPSDSKEEYESSIKTYFAELKKTRKDNEGTFKDWKVISYTLEEEYAVVTIEYKYFEDGKWGEEEADFTCVKQEKGWVVDVYDFYEIPEKSTEVPDDVKETDKIAELEKTIEKLKSEISELKAGNKELKELIK